MFNLSADPVKLTVDSGATAALLPISEGATLARTRLGLSANGFAIFSEAPGTPRLDIKFNRRAKKAVV